MDRATAGWRRQLRIDLLARRKIVPMEARRHAADIISHKLTQILDVVAPAVVGIYWPINHEINLLPWARSLAQSDTVTLCLPVVVQSGAPLEYWRWTPETPMRPAVWNIPCPVEQCVVTPDLVLAPVVGFDPARYRLGYGGGYFDRTLAAMQRRSIAIGVGYDYAALDTIRPQPHDIPMDAILTEQRSLLPAAWGLPTT
jgi:5,10-methenyltetrahydrofolate synthetase